MQSNVKGLLRRTTRLALAVLLACSSVPSAAMAEASDELSLGGGEQIAELDMVAGDDSGDEDLALEVADGLEDVGGSADSIVETDSGSLVSEEGADDAVSSEDADAIVLDGADDAVSEEPSGTEEESEPAESESDAKDDFLTTQASSLVSGTCGTCSWSIDSTGCLTISAGTLSNDLSGTVDGKSSYYNPPWRDSSYRSLVNSVNLSGRVQAGTSLARFLNYCDNLTSANLTNLDTSRVTDMSDMFYGCVSLRSLNLLAFKTSQVQRMDYMFGSCRSLTSLDLSSFNTSGVLSAEGMFLSCDALSSFKVSDSYAMSRVDMVPYPTAYHNKWWSTSTKKWLDRDQVRSTRSRKTDTYKNKTSIANAKVTVAKQTYTGKAIKPDLKVTCGGQTLYYSSTADYSDYLVSFKNNKKIGTATITLKGRRDYTGTLQATFKIVPIKMSATYVEYVSSSYYTGKAKKPSPKVTYQDKTLKKGRDYTLSYKKNVNAGTATIIIKGKGNYAGTTKRTFTIYQQYMSKVKVSKVSDKWYTGKAIKPKPKVKYAGKTLKRGKDYTLSYSNNKRPGLATIRIKGKGNFYGTTYVYFYIRN